MARSIARSKIERREYAENHHLFREQELGDHAFILEEGTVQITRQVGNKVLVPAASAPTTFWRTPPMFPTDPSARMVPVPAMT